LGSAFVIEGALALGAASISTSSVIGALFVLALPHDPIKSGTKAAPNCLKEKCLAVIILIKIANFIFH
jgi:hypothetical protein